MLILFHFSLSIKHEKNFSPKQKILISISCGIDSTVLYDLIYNPAETLFLKKGKTSGCKIKNGLEMLEVQANEAWRIWNS